MSSSRGSPNSGTRALPLKRALALVLLLASAAWAQPDERELSLESGETIRFQVLDAAIPDHYSARRISERLLRHLAAGELEEAALLSTAPRRRYEELVKYAERVGEREFKAVFERYLAAGAPLLEVAIDRHRLLVWDLAEGGESRMAGQYFVLIEGRFLLDDVPNETRRRLRLVLEAYRSGRLRLSGRTG